jgi:uncharacterized protein YyaL (SSP411 family)
MNRPVNRLISEKSPYLLQHAHNPVAWYPWSADAFERARSEDKPVFLSIGYSTCHWCHVMEQESFEDPDIAQLLNETFVAIKVDREERPDIDRTYMRVCQLMTGSGGWPLTIVMTPDQKPFFAATYIPRDTHFGHVGMRELIPRIREIWKTRRDSVTQSTEEILSHLRQMMDSSDVSTEELTTEALDEVFLALFDSFDGENGGFGRAPKFPSPHQLAFLLRYWRRTGRADALRMVEKTLDAMRLGGIYDHIGYGFHRYSTDRYWRVPHFEKMLYDQALLTLIYIEAYQATGNVDYQATAREILTYVLRNMMAPHGGFYSAEDADVDGEEGKFYLWTTQQLQDHLSPEEYTFIAKLFNITKQGNFAIDSGSNQGANIFYMSKSFHDHVDSDLTPSEMKARWKQARETLYALREIRVHPSKDDKILTDWNGLMIAALARAARVFDEPQYLKAAQNAVTFITTTMQASPSTLLHRYRDGDAAIPGFIDDYAFLIWGLLELYETTFISHYLEYAHTLMENLLQEFWDPEQKGFFFTPAQDDPILVRNKDGYDGAYPSGNSVAMLALLHLARLTGNMSYEAQATLIPQAFRQAITRTPAAHTHMMMALDFALGPSYEVIIVGDPKMPDTTHMLMALRRQFIPNKVVHFRPANVEEHIIDQFLGFTPHTDPYSAIQATAYVCHNFQCELPTTKVSVMLRQLEASDAE